VAAVGNVRRSSADRGSKQLAMAARERKLAAPIRGPFKARGAAAR
jgi:hypothetical protein